MRFLRDVKDEPDRADEIDDESLDSYAERRKIRLSNPTARRGSKMAQKSVEDYRDQVKDLKQQIRDLEEPEPSARMTSWTASPTLSNPMERTTERTRATTATITTRTDPAGVRAGLA